MILHFVFVVREEDLDDRRGEFEYVQQMGRFFQVWIRARFSLDVEVRCDQMITHARSMLQRLDTHTLIDDHRSRGSGIFHFYLCHFRPTWTDCTCEGYHSENFGMVFWRRPKAQDDWLFLAEKNCTTVSHELAHELLRQAGYKRYGTDVHDIWTRHLFDGLEFEQYSKDFERTDAEPWFLAIDLSSLEYGRRVSTL